MRDLGVADKVENAIRDSEYDAVVVAGADHVQYMSGAFLPFLYSYPDRPAIVLWPKNGDPVCICPAEWETTIRSMSRIRRVRPYGGVGADTEAVVQEVVRAVGDLVGDGASIGADMNRVSQHLFSRIRESLSAVELVACDDWLVALRTTKTPEEVELLKDAAYRTDHGILGALHHVLVYRRPPETAIAEGIRVHCLERFLDLVGDHAISQVAAGENSEEFWPLAPRYGLGGHKKLEAGHMVRVEMRASLDGYWSDAARMMVMGQPTQEQQKAYQQLVTLRETALQHLKPGTKCSYLYRLVAEDAMRRGVELLPSLSFGHGIGVTSYEPPYLSESDHTELRPGMVLVLDPVVRGPVGEIMRSKDTVVVTETGCQIVGWYKDWREPYIASTPIANSG